MLKYQRLPCVTKQFPLKKSFHLEVTAPSLGSVSASLEGSVQFQKEVENRWENWGSMTLFGAPFPTYAGVRKQPCLRHGKLHCSPKYLPPENWCWQVILWFQTDTYLGIGHLGSYISKYIVIPGSSQLPNGIWVYAIEYLPKSRDSYPMDFKIRWNIYKEHLTGSGR